MIGNGESTEETQAHNHMEIGLICLNKMGVLTDTELHNIGVIRPANNKVYKQDR